MPLFVSYLPNPFDFLDFLAFVENAVFGLHFVEWISVFDWVMLESVVQFAVWSVVFVAGGTANKVPKAAVQKDLCLIEGMEIGVPHPAEERL